MRTVCRTLISPFPIILFWLSESSSAESCLPWHTVCIPKADSWLSVLQNLGILMSLPPDFWCAACLALTVGWSWASADEPRKRRTSGRYDIREAQMIARAGSTTVQMTISPRPSLETAQYDNIFQVPGDRETYKDSPPDWWNWWGTSDEPELHNWHCGSRQVSINSVHAVQEYIAYTIPRLRTNKTIILSFHAIWTFQSIAIGNRATVYISNSQFWTLMNRVC